MYAFERFESPYELTNFLNSKNIKKENIIQIVLMSSGWGLYYVKE